MELLVTQLEDIEVDVTCSISNGLACSHAIRGHDFNIPGIPNSRCMASLSSASSPRLVSNESGKVPAKMAFLLI
jgi:hypothetical protein